MAARVYLHIGAPKTGTTYLQDALWAHESGLRSAGILVPGGRRFAAFHAAQAIREVPWLREMPSGRRDVWDDMQRRIRDWPGIAVLSHEFLGAATRDQAARAIRALQPADVHVVLTARDYVAQLPAMWQETVKMGSRQPLRRYARRVLDGDKRGPWSRATMDIAATLDRWSASISPDRVHVVTMPVSRTDPSLLWRRFSQLCEIDPDRFPAPTRPSNESLTAVDTELLRRVSADLPESLQAKRVRHRWVRGFLAQQVLAGRSGDRPVLDPQAARRARRWAEQCVAEIRQRGYHVVGDLDELVSAPLPPAEGRRTISDEQLVESAAVTIGELVDQYRLLSAQVDELTDQVRLMNQARRGDERPRDRGRGRARRRGHDGRARTEPRD